MYGKFEWFGLHLVFPVTVSVNMARHSERFGHTRYWLDWTTIFTTYVRPLVEYASPVWSPCTLTAIDRIETVQRRFTKRITGLQSHSYHIQWRILEFPKGYAEQGSGDGSPPARSRGGVPVWVWGRSLVWYIHNSQRAKTSIQRHIQHYKNSTNLAQEIKLVWSSQSELVNDFDRFD